MRGTPLLLEALIVVTSFGTANAVGAERMGSICIAPLPERARELDHDSPGGKALREYSYDFAIQIDDRKPLPVSDTAQLLAGLRVRNRHRVRIYDRDKVIESFYFTFEKRGSKHLCLSYTPWYQTWSLEKPQKRPWCRCAKPAAYLGAAPESDTRALLHSKIDTSQRVARSR